MSDVHVVFGTGSLGSAVMQQLAAAGKTVRAVSRSGRGVPAGIETAKADATDSDACIEACRGAAAIYFCAAPAYTDWAGTYEAMQTGAIEAAAANDAVLVSAESIYMYGAVDGPITEDRPYAPCSKKGEIRVRLTEQLLGAHAAGKAKTVAARAPDYYGPGAAVTTVYGERVFPNALKGRAAEIFGRADALHTWIYVDDFARGMVTLAAHEEAWGRPWHLPCPPALTQAAFLDAIFAAAGHPTKHRAMPTWLTPILGWFVPVMRELAEMQYQWTSDYDFRHEAFDAAFGGGHTPHEEGIARTLDWFKGYG